MCSYASAVGVLGPKGGDSAHFILALPGENDFERARSALPEFAGLERYDDLLDEADGFHIGLSAAGAHVEMVHVALSGFLSWRSNFDKPLDLASLSEFAFDVRSIRAGARWRAAISDAPRWRRLRHDGDRVSLRRREYEMWLACRDQTDAPQLRQEYAREMFLHWSAASS